MSRLEFPGGTVHGWRCMDGWMVLASQSPFVDFANVLAFLRNSRDFPPPSVDRLCVTRSLELPKRSRMLYTDYRGRVSNIHVAIVLHCVAVRLRTKGKRMESEDFWFFLHRILSISASFASPPRVKLTKCKRASARWGRRWPWGAPGLRRRTRSSGRSCAPRGPAGAASPSWAVLSGSSSARVEKRQFR